jgi:AraC family transcriptional regulator of adaptative response/methylated-DNA-[protein]-cysteine methyltransferase
MSTLQINAGISGYSHAELYQALHDRDARYLATFVAGVRTTGIFCLPTCRARKPRPENVEFFENARAALHAGYRPCKICKPTEHLSHTTPDMRHALELVHQSDAPRISDEDLRDAGLHPETVRRHFKRVYGMTFHAYQRLLRLNSAYRALKGGRGVLDAGLEGKYESSSGFYRAYERVMRTTPADGSRLTVITISHLDTPIGPMIAGATDDGLCLLEFSDRRMLETQFDTLVRRLDARFLYGTHPVLDETHRQLDAYFAGRLKDFTIPLVTPGTDFQKLVWQQLRRIPYGAVRSYTEQAQAIDRPRAVRAVASANGHNRIAIVIPCHRVIGSDGSMTGYGGGIPRKQWLLRHETAHC